MSVPAVSSLAVERRAEEGRRTQVSRLLASLRSWRDQTPSATHAERNRNPIDGAEATGRRVLAQTWGWS